MSKEAHGSSDSKTDPGPRSPSAMNRNLQSPRAGKEKNACGQDPRPLVSFPDRRIKRNVNSSIHLATGPEGLVPSSAHSPHGEHQKVEKQGVSGQTGAEKVWFRLLWCSTPPFLRQRQRRLGYNRAWDSTGGICNPGLIFPGLLEPKSCPVSIAFQL